MTRRVALVIFLILTLGLLAWSQDMLRNLGKTQDYVSNRISSYDHTGGNNDRLSIPAGDTITLAEIAGPAAIHHIWVTIAGEAFYGRNFSSLAINCSSEGRARNCYWYMPFRRSARLTVTNKGQNPVGALLLYRLPYVQIAPS